MKRIFIQKFLYLSLFGLSSSVMAETLIYGLENAANLNLKMGGSIQAGSFTNQAYAIRYQHQLQSFTTVPVHIVHKNVRYKVMIGPMRTSLRT